MVLQDLLGIVNVTKLLHQDSGLLPEMPLLVCPEPFWFKAEGRLIPKATHLIGFAH